MASDDDDCCPLCVEPYESADRLFMPCSCGFQICMFCWNKIKETGNGCCPACRHQFTTEAMLRKGARLEDVAKQQVKPKPVPTVKNKPVPPAPSKPVIKPPPAPGRPSKSQLRDVRVVQRNLVYIIGLSPAQAKESLLKSAPYFGQYGRIIKVVVSREASTDKDRAPSFSAFITYSREAEARACIFAVDGFWVDGRCLRVCFGTTKYCHAWLREEHCTTPDCLYLHDPGAPEDSFSRDEMLGPGNSYGWNFSELVHPNWSCRNGNGVVGGQGNTQPGTSPETVKDVLAAARAKGLALPPLPPDLVATVLHRAVPPPAYAVTDRRGKKQQLEIKTPAAVAAEKAAAAATAAAAAATAAAAGKDAESSRAVGSATASRLSGAGGVSSEPPLPDMSPIVQGGGEGRSVARLGSAGTVAHASSTAATVVKGTPALPAGVEATREPSPSPALPSPADVSLWPALPGKPPSVAGHGKPLPKTMLPAMQALGKLGALGKAAGSAAPSAAAVVTGKAGGGAAKPPPAPAPSAKVVSTSPAGPAARGEPARKTAASPLVAGLRVEEAQPQQRPPAGVSAGGDGSDDSDTNADVPSVGPSGTASTRSSRRAEKLKAKRQAKKEARAADKVAPVQHAATTAAGQSVPAPTAGKSASKSKAKGGDASAAARSALPTLTAALSTGSGSHAAGDAILLGGGTGAATDSLLRSLLPASSPFNVNGSQLGWPDSFLADSLSVTSQPFVPTSSAGAGGEGSLLGAAVDAPPPRSRLGGLTDVGSLAGFGTSSGVQGMDLLSGSFSGGLFGGSVSFGGTSATGEVGSSTTDSLLPVSIEMLLRGTKDTGLGMLPMPASSGSSTAGGSASSLYVPKGLGSLGIDASGLGLGGVGSGPFGGGFTNLTGLGSGTGMSGLGDFPAFSSRSPSGSAPPSNGAAWFDSLPSLAGVLPSSASVGKLGGDAASSLGYMGGSMLPMPPPHGGGLEHAGGQSFTPAPASVMAPFEAQQKSGQFPQLRADYPQEQMQQLVQQHIQQRVQRMQQTQQQFQQQMKQVQQLQQLQQGQQGQHIHPGRGNAPLAPSVQALFGHSLAKPDAAGYASPRHLRSGSHKAGGESGAEIGGPHVDPLGTQLQGGDSVTPGLGQSGAHAQHAAIVAALARAQADKAHAAQAHVNAEQQQRALAGLLMQVQQQQARQRTLQAQVQAQARMPSRPDGSLDMHALSSLLNELQGSALSGGAGPGLDVMGQLQAIIAPKHGPSKASAGRNGSTLTGVEQSPLVVGGAGAASGVKAVQGGAGDRGGEEDEDRDTAPAQGGGKQTGAKKRRSRKALLKAIAAAKAAAAPQ